MYCLQSAKILRVHIGKPANLHWDTSQSALRQSSKIVQNRTSGTLKFFFNCFLIMIFFTVNPIIFGEVLAAKKHVICWNITTYKNMDVKLLHPVWKDFLDTVNCKYCCFDRILKTADYFLIWHTTFLSNWIRMWSLDQNNRK